MSHQSDLISQDILGYLKQHEQKDLLRFLTCGNVDDGKSTLIGRLLYDSKLIYEDQLQAVIEDQLVRADLIIISGERHDDSFDLITRTLSKMGEITAAEVAIESSGRHNFGLIGPDKVPVVTLPGDPIAAYISFELLVRPMIRTMLGASTIHRPSVKARLEKGLQSNPDARSYVRAILSEDGTSVAALGSQDEQATLSDANAFIAIPEGESEKSAGAEVTVVVLERRYI
jgi:molybdopterin biosynthesis enzyme